MSRETTGVEGGTNIGSTPTTFDRVHRGVYLAVSGDLTFTMEGGESLALVGMAAGVWHPMRFTAITAITTASGVCVGY
jgi:hypothetical protein